MKGNWKMFSHPLVGEVATRRGVAFAVFISLAALTTSLVSKIGADSGDDDDDDQGDKDKTQPPTPEENYAKRFPQAVHVSDVLGKPILDDDNAVIGRVQRVVRAADGKIQFIIPYGGLFGAGQRLVAAPIETLASIGTSLLALDMPQEKFRTAPTWYGLNAQVLGPDETIRVAVTRR